jgi:hypothetical protein
MDWSIFVSLGKSWLSSGLPDPRWWIALVASLSIILGALFIIALLQAITGQDLDRASTLALGLSGAPLVLILVAFPVLIWGVLRGTALDFQTIFILLACGLGFGTLLLHLRRKGGSGGSSRAWAGLALLLAGLTLLRLSFLRGLLLPPYFDSVEHFQIVNDLLHPEGPPQAFYTLARITQRYYHFGFHALAAWVSGLTGASPADTILVLGQLLQALIPISLFFPIKTATRSDAAALFGVLLAGLGWRMPAFASNWGKYPALTGIATFPFGLGAAFLAFSSLDKKERRRLFGLAALAAVLSTLAHTRSVILLIAAAVSWFAAGKALQAKRTWRILMAVAFTVLLFWLARQIAGDQGLLFMLQPYLWNSVIPSVLVALLMPFGLKQFPQATLAGLLWLLILLLSALTPSPGALERLGYLSLLDRPFVQMTLFLPLALIGGAGLAGLKHTLLQSSTRKWADFQKRLWPFLSLSLCLVVTLNALRSYSFTPSPCCQLVTQDDLAAYAWIRGNLPPEATILIASNRIPNQTYGVDGGIWITPLTGRQTKKWPHNTPLDSQAALEKICASGATHIYAGGTAARFSVESMASKPAWYQGLFALPRAYLFAITGCEGSP